MSTAISWNGVSYSVPSAGEVNWPSLSNFLIALGNNASNNITEKQAIRVATSTPVTVSATTDCTVVSNLSVAGAVAMNLPAGVDGQMFFLLDGKQDAASNNITVTPNGAETINGAATLVMNHNGQGVWIQYKSSTSNWYVLANIVVPGTITPADIVGVIPANKGGTGIANNASSTLTISGAYATTLTVSGATGVTLPTTGTLATLAGSETLSNKTIASPTVTGELLLQNPSGSQPTLALSEDPDNGTNKIIVQAPATLGGDWTWTLPPDDGDSGEVLTTNGSGVTTWEPAATVPATAGPVYSNGSALASTAFSGNGNKVVGIDSGGTTQELKTLAVGTTGTDFAVAQAVGSITFNLPDAGASARGVVTTGTQTFAGAKTFSNGTLTVGSTGAVVTAGGANSALDLTATGTGDLNFVTNGVTRGQILDTADVLFAAPSGFTGNHLTLSQGDTGDSQNFIVATNTSQSKFIVLGTGNCQNRNNSYAGISDERHKENICDLDPMLDRLMQVRMRKFSFKVDKAAFPNDLGVIAQELESVFPEFIEKKNPAEYAVAYSKFVPVLMKALQEQQHVISGLQERLSALESK